MNTPARRVALSSFVVLALALAVTGPAAAQPTDLIISEYIEGSSNNKAIEFFNGTAAAIDLNAGGYRVETYSNGSATVSSFVALTGTVAAGSTYVIAPTDASQALRDLADQVTGSNWFNGDDALVLRKGGAGGTVLDSFGQVGVDPGASWGTGILATANHTLRRKSSVCAGDTVINNAFDPAPEWDGFDVDTFSGLRSHSVSCTPAGTTLSINDVSSVEGNAGTTTFTFTVSLSAPAPAGGVTFDIATANNTATTADNDYATNSLTGQTIPAGSSTYAFNVTVNGDVNVEANETFYVNVTNVTGTGVTVADGQGLGTIQNDDVAPLIKIGAIQGTGTASPEVGNTVTTKGVVTGRTTAGFFIQEAPADSDGNPLTSDGIYVYTNSAPAASIAIGDVVTVQGRVSEYFGLTELGAPLTITEPDPPAALPAPVVLTPALPSASPAVWEQLEHLEGMRVSVPSMTVVVPTTGFDANNYTTGNTGNGIFYGVVTGVARPMREAGFPYPDPIPVGSTIPRWDANPELIKVESDGLVGGLKLDVASRTVLTNVIGPLTYDWGRYMLLPDPLLAGVTAPPTVATPFAPIPVTPPAANELTVASYNLQRFYDDINGPIDDTDENGTSAAEFALRLAKASLHIRTHMQMPDVVGLIEVEDLPTLQRLATQISTDALAASQPDPLYAAYLVEGNDVGGIDVGYLVKTAGGRVTGITVTQELDGSVLNNPDGSTSTLHDRPPLMLRAVVNGPAGATYPVTVILNHLRSLNDITSTAAEGNGWVTKGDRVRAKRLAQAVDLANFVQARQAANPAERIIVMGDMNAFEVNDGYVHSMGTITGQAYLSTDTLVDAATVPDDGTDLVTPDLVNLLSTKVADERYGYTFDYSAQNLDHMLVSAGLVAATPTYRMEHARVNADFHETDRSTLDRRLSDHDPIVGYFAFATAGVSVTMTDSPDPVFPGAGLTYAITVSNGGPDAASALVLTDTLPANTVFASLTSPAGWSCTTPAVGAPGTVTCSAATLAAAANATFTLNVTVVAGTPGGTLLSNTASVAAASGDPNLADNSATATTAVQTPPAVFATKSAAGAYKPGGAVTYTIVLTNNGSTAQLDNPGNELTDVLPSSLVLVSASATSGTAVATVATNTVTWNGSIPAGGSVTVTVNATISAAVAVGTAISNQATVSYDADGNGTNEATVSTDDPTTGAAGDPTVFTVNLDASGVAVVPAAGTVGLGLLALLVALGGALLVGRRLS